jgi:hypothetical protein
VPGLSEFPAGAAADQVTELSKLPVPCTAALNCTWVPMVAVVGVTVIEVTAGPVGVTGAVGALELPPPHPLNSSPTHASKAIAAHQP